MEYSLKTSDQLILRDGKPFGEDNKYDNKKKATKKQRDEIINTIIHNKYDTVGTDIIKIGNSIFLCDSSRRNLWLCR
jgi:hypothetical protein